MTDETSYKELAFIPFRSPGGSYLVKTRSDGVALVPVYVVSDSRSVQGVQVLLHGFERDTDTRYRAIASAHLVFMADSHARMIQTNYKTWQDARWGGECSTELSKLLSKLIQDSKPTYMTPDEVRLKYRIRIE